MAEPFAGGHADFIMNSISPETTLERELLADPRLQAGLEWGAPRFGHPEGRVGEHVAAMLAATPINDRLRDDLRFLALVHDSFKAEVRPDESWSRDNDHAMLARRFAERYTSDQRLLTTLELHDEPYWIWRNSDAPERALRPLLERLPDPELFARFVELDASNEGKDLTFLWWFRRELAIEGRFPRHPVATPGDDSQDVVYLKAFATLPEQQPAVARAAQQLVAEQRDRMQADGEVLTSDDGLRVVLLWRWHGSRRDLIERDADFVREALAAHPIFTDTRAVEARIFHTLSGRNHGDTDPDRRR
ncbi:MAG: hypothetical protein ACXVSF_18540 [Solirubrobacteraceae bacterium]